MIQVSITTTYSIVPCEFYSLNTALAQMSLYYCFSEQTCWMTSWQNWHNSNSLPLIPILFFTLCAFWTRIPLINICALSNIAWIWPWLGRYIQLQHKLTRCNTQSESDLHYQNDIKKGYKYLWLNGQYHYRKCWFYSSFTIKMKISN